MKLTPLFRVCSISILHSPCEIVLQDSNHFSWKLLGGPGWDHGRRRRQRKLEPESAMTLPLWGGGGTEEVLTPLHTVVKTFLFLPLLWPNSGRVDARPHCGIRTFQYFLPFPLAEVQSPTISNSFSQLQALDFLRFSAEIAD